MLRVLIFSVACASAFHVMVPNSAVAMKRVVPSMQFFNPKKDSVKPKPETKVRRGMIYDDEEDTVSRDYYKPNFVENGEVDLANIGGPLYLAFIPFLLIVIAYSTGIFSFGYNQGNF